MLAGINEREKKMFMELGAVTELMRMVTQKTMEDIRKMDLGGDKREVLANLEYTLSVCSPGQLARISEFLFGRQSILEKEAHPDREKKIETGTDSILDQSEEERSLGEEAIAMLKDVTEHLQSGKGKVYVRI